MGGTFIQSGNLTGAVGSTGTLQANVASQGELKATISSESTLQATMSAAGTLGATITPQKTLGGNIYMSRAATEKTPRIGSVTLLASAWVGESNLYHQVVEIEGATAKSQVDLTPSVEQLLIFYEKDLAFVAENEGGVITVYAIGQKPANDYTMQVTMTEVVV